MNQMEPKFVLKEWSKWDFPSLVAISSNYNIADWYLPIMQRTCCPPKSEWESPGLNKVSASPCSPVPVLCYLPRGSYFNPLVAVCSSGLLCCIRSRGVVPVMSGGIQDLWFSGLIFVKLYVQLFLLCLSAGKFFNFSSIISVPQVGAATTLLTLWFLCIKRFSRIGSILCTGFPSWRY